MLVLGIFDFGLVLLGYIASAYTWPWLRTKLGGIQVEIQDLEARVLSLKSTVKPASPPISAVAPAPPTATPPAA